jgi:hypothetical protein
MPDNPDYPYYAPLSSLISVDALPAILGFVQDKLQDAFSKLYFKNYQESKSYTGSSAFYGLEIISRTKLAIELPGTGIFFVLNPDFTNNESSSFPVEVLWDWKVLSFVRSFNLNNFSFNAEDLYKLGL